MLQTFRDRSGGLFIKILFGLLVASFVLWGVGDVFRYYTSSRPLVTVGSNSISQEEFLKAYQRVINNVQVLSKGKISIDDIKKMNLYQKVIDDLIDMKVAKELVHQFHLVATDEAVRNHIQALPAFQNDKGQFDRKKLDLLLSNNGLTESGFIKEVREAILQQQVFGSLNMGPALPSSYQETLFQALHQQRGFAVAHIPLSHIKIAHSPSPEEMEKTYADYQSQLSNPEYRQLTYMVIDPAVLKERLKIEAEQVKEAYNSRLSQFSLPETRHVGQLIFVDQKQAHAASQALNNGQSLASVAQQFNAELRQIEQATPDKFIPAHSDVIFALPAGKASDVLESALGYTVFMVTQIQPSKVKPLEEVQSKLEEDLKIEKVNDELYDLRNKIEDALSSGVTLQEIAKDHQLDLHAIPMVDKKGQDEHLKGVLPETYQGVILENAFAIPEGTDSPLVDVGEGKSLVIHVEKVIPAVLPPLDQIKDKVIDLWTKKQQEEKAANLAADIEKEVDSLSKLKEVAAKHGLSLSFVKPLSRVELEKQKQSIEGLPVNFIQSAFALSPKKAMYGATEKGFALIMVEKTLPFEISKEKDKLASFKESLKKMLEQDVQTSYISFLRNKDKVSINEEMLQRLIHHS